MAGGLEQVPGRFAAKDRLIHDRYGFTDEELDFIINYDIKYRMGGAAQRGEE